MDSLDVRIWRELVHDKPKYPLPSDVRRSYQSIATRLHVTEETVRTRILRLEKAGFLLGWLLIANPNLVGQRISQLWFDLPSVDSKAEAIAAVRRIPGVVIVHDCYGASLSLYLVSASEESFGKQVDAIRRTTGARGLVHGTLAFPPSEHHFSLTDWRIFLILVENPRKSYGAVAKELGLSPRTVRRRLLRMTEAAALFLVPRFNPKAMEGTLGLLVVFYDPRFKREVDHAIVSRLGDVLLGAELGDREHSFCPMLVTNAARVEEILAWSRALPGVRLVRLDMLNDRIEVLENFDAILRQTLASSLKSGDLERLRLPIGSSQATKTATASALTKS